MDTRAAKRKIGDIGEDIAVKFLVKHGFVVVERNYLRKWGEIDVVCRKDDLYHFIEVKTVSRETRLDDMGDVYRPEDNVHNGKLRRIANTIQTYLLDRDVDDDWKFHVLAITLDSKNRTAKVRMLENLVI